MLDSERVAQCARLPHARSVDDALRALFDRRQHVAYEPKSQEEVDALARACRQPGRVNVLVDEAHAWLTARSHAGSPLIRLMRAHRHARCSLFLTTHHLSGDVPQAAVACAPSWYVFRCTSPTTLDRLAALGLDIERIRRLPQWSYLAFREGF